MVSLAGLHHSCGLWLVVWCQLTQATFAFCSCPSAFLRWSTSVLCKGMCHCLILLQWCQSFIWWCHCLLPHSVVILLDGNDVIVWYNDVIIRVHCWLSWCHRLFRGHSPSCPLCRHRHHLHAVSRAPWSVWWVSSTLLTLCVLGGGGGWCERKSWERERDRQADRQTDRQRYRQAGRQRCYISNFDFQTDRQNLSVTFHHFSCHDDKTAFVTSCAHHASKPLPAHHRHWLREMSVTSQAPTFTSGFPLRFLSEKVQIYIPNHLSCFFSFHSFVCI